MAATTTFDRLTPEDVQILRREGGTVRGHTCKVLVLERSPELPLPTVQALRENIERRLDAAPRLRQRLVPTPLRVARPMWLDDPQFDIARHVTVLETGGPVTRSGLQQIVGSLMTERLDRAHPLWRLDVVERLEAGAMALIWRIHHALADGTTCLRLCSETLWNDDPFPPAARSSSWRPQPAPGAVRLLAMGLRDRRLPPAAHPQVPRGVTSFWDAQRIIRRELRRGAAVTPLAGRVGTTRSVGLATAPLGDCRRAGKAIGESVTLNDVILAIIAGAVKRWLEHSHGPNLAIRVKVPVSLHRKQEAEPVANRDSYFLVDLPIAEPDPVQRVLAINRETRERKLDHDAETLYRLGRHPFVSHWAMSPRVFAFNISNVRGPVSAVYVLGARVRELYSLAEISQHHALRMAVISCGDRLSFGLCADGEAISDPHVLLDGIKRSTEELVRLSDSSA